MGEEIVDKLLEVKNRRNLFSDEQIDLFRQFDKYISTRRNITKKTRVGQMDTIIRFADELGKPIEDVTKEELMDYLSKRQETHKPSSMEQMKCLIKKFYHWRERDDLISWIKLDASAYKKDRNPDDLWTWSDIKQLLKAFSHIQHQALTIGLYESEARISELISMNICDVTDLGGDVIEIWLPDSKTQRRPVKLTHSVIYLRKWLDQHPYKNQPDHALWISKSCRSKDRRLKANSVNEMFHRAQKRSGINKKLTPHLLRHSYASYIEENNLMSHTSHCYRMGISPNSKVLQNYIHISQQQANNEYLRSQGVTIDQDEKSQPQFTPIKCWRCGIENTPTAQYCSMCGEDFCSMRITDEVRAMIESE